MFHQCIQYWRQFCLLRWRQESNLYCRRDRRESRLLFVTHTENISTVCYHYTTPPFVGKDRFELPTHSLTWRFVCCWLPFTGSTSYSVALPTELLPLVFGWLDETRTRDPRLKRLYIELLSISLVSENMCVYVALPSELQASVLALSRRFELRYPRSDT